ncbi:MAG: DUF1629 domain-containing protein [Pseudomonadota bacterium]
MHLHQLSHGSKMRDGTQLVAEEIVAADGDVSKVVHRDKSDHGGMLIKNTTFDYGRPIQTEHVPTTWTRKPSKNPIPDVMSAWKGCLFVSERFKDVVEEFEPGVHQFLPAALQTRGKIVAEMYYFVVCTRLDALDPGACIPPLEPGARMFAGVRAPGDKIVFDARKVAGHHVFHDRRVTGRFVSQEFRDAIEAGPFDAVRFLTPLEMSHL